MRVEHLKRLPALIVSALLLVSVGIASADTTNKPYLKTFGGDVMSGGWYSSGAGCSTDPSSNYQDQNYPTATPDVRNGGIIAYANQNASGYSTGGSSSQYAVFSLGSVDNNSAPSGYGFYSAGVLAAPPTVSGTVGVNVLSFANSNVTYPWGGLFEGGVRQTNCIPDYYSQRPSSASALNHQLVGASAPSGTYVGLSFGTCDTNVYCLTGNSITIKATPTPTRLTIYVSGNVYIGDNIKYENHDASSIPKFALIVSGSIYIGPNVTQLDGLYIAQPATNNAATVSADDGVIWTCHPSNTATLDYFYPPTCTSPLVVNGALIAKQVNFLRVRGDIGSASTNEDNPSTTITNCTTSPYGGCNVAETINYTPDVIMGGGFFNSSSSSSSSGALPVDSVISLPPVF